MSQLLGIAVEMRTQLLRLNRVLETINKRQRQELNRIIEAETPPGIGDDSGDELKNVQKHLAVRKTRRKPAAFPLKA